MPARTGPSPLARRLDAAALLVALLAVLLPSGAVPGRLIPTAAATPAGPRYAIDTIVIQFGTGDPQVCAGPIAASLPPRCGGPVVTPWDWARVGQQQSRDVMWSYRLHLVGTFDGTTFHLTQPPTPPTPRQVPDETATPTPCHAPAGGWRVIDPARVDDRHWNAVTAYAHRQPGSAAAWLSWPAGYRVTERSPYSKAVLNLAFSRDVAKYERGARARWGGPLCVTRFRYSRADLERFRAELDRGSPQRLLSDGILESRNAVHGTVLVVDDATRAYVASHFPPGTVVLEGALRPVG
jgi:hypothetical protein